jgi:hypothetical protein
MKALLRAAVVIATAIGLAATGTAIAASSRDSYVRHHIAFTQIGVFQQGNQEGLSINFVTPSAWAPLKQTRKTHLSFHVGTTNCRYSVTFATRLASAEANPAPLEHVTTELPVAGSAYVIDQGTRNSSTAWRVTRLKPSGAPGAGRIQLRAMRADRRTLAGVRAWQETVVSATSRAADECHAGTYRDVVGPQIGDALATATGRAYSFRPKK